MNKLKEYIRNSLLYKCYKNIIIKAMYHLPVCNKKVIFDNFGGKGFGDDPKYIAEELLKRNLGLDLIWVTSDMSLEFPKGIRKVKYGTIKAAYHWSTAKVWVDNIKSSIKVNKKPEQFYIQTWHSTLGFKKNEKDAKTLTERYITQSKKDAEITNLMYSNNDFRVDKYRNSYWYSGEVIKCDVPRMSILINTPETVRDTVRKYFSISEGKKIVLYAPTFRKKKSLNTYFFNYSNCLRALKTRFNNDFVMLIRLHPNESKFNGELNVYDGVNILNASNYPDMQELLAVSDVLITDYSGCMFDFGLVYKPVFLFAKDLQAYLSEDREVYFRLDKVPFKLATNEEDLIINIESFSNEEYLDSCKKFSSSIGYIDSGNGAIYISDLIIEKLGMIGNN